MLFIRKAFNWVRHLKATLTAPIPFVLIIEIVHTFFFKLKRRLAQDDVL